MPNDFSLACGTRRITDVHAGTVDNQEITMVVGGKGGSELMMYAHNIRSLPSGVKSNEKLKIINERFEQQDLVVLLETGANEERKARSPNDNFIKDREYVMESTHENRNLNIGAGTAIFRREETQTIYTTEKLNNHK